MPTDRLDSWGQGMADTAPAGRTIIAIDFDELRHLAHSARVTSEHAFAAQQAMRQARIGTSALGLMNAPLALTLARLSARANDLSDEVQHLANALSENTETLVRSWREVEQQADTATRKLMDRIGSFSDGDL